MQLNGMCTLRGWLVLSFIHLSTLNAATYSRMLLSLRTCARNVVKGTASAGLRIKCQDICVCVCMFFTHTRIRMSILNIIISIIAFAFSQ